MVLSPIIDEKRLKTKEERYKKSSAKIPVNRFKQAVIITDEERRLLDEVFYMCTLGYKNFKIFIIIFHHCRYTLMRFLEIGLKNCKHT